MGIESLGRSQRVLSLLPGGLVCESSNGPIAVGDLPQAGLPTSSAMPTTSATASVADFALPEEATGYNSRLRLAG